MQIIKILVFGVIVGVSFNLMVRGASAFKEREYQLWGKVLQEYVDDQGKVDYAKLQKNQADLNGFIEKVRNADIDGMSDIEQKTFWINAYNALTMQLIVDKYPLKLGGIRTINWGRPWSIKMRVAHRDLTLNDIEHKILRPLGDPRVHFALNCASIGCPKLPNKPFDPQRLDEQLDFEARRFMNDPQKVRLDRAADILYHSELLDWYEDDFLAVADDPLNYIKQYLNEEDQSYLEARKVTLKKIKYDWGLNEAKTYGTK